MDLIISCGVRNIVFDRDAILQQSKILSDHFTSEVCCVLKAAVGKGFGTQNLGFTTELSIAIFV